MLCNMKALCLSCEIQTCQVAKESNQNGVNFTVFSNSLDESKMMEGTGDGDDFRGAPNVQVDMEFIEQNPEAIFDYITIRSMQDRYGNAESPREDTVDVFPQTEPRFQNELEFETFVQQFPIDDSIAECFAMTSEAEVVKQDSGKFLSGGKRPQGTNRYHKLKKRFGWKFADDTVSEDETRSRDSKRSKKGGVFSKRHKWRNVNNSKKSVNFSDQSETETIGDVMDDGRSRGYQISGVSPASPTDSTSVTDSHITSFSDTLSQDADQKVPQSREPVYKRDNFIQQTKTPETKQIRHQSREDVPDDCFRQILVGDTISMIQKMEDIPPEEAKKMRDHHGNTLLHRCVMIGNADAVKFILEKYPEMTSEMNTENSTAVEVAAKLGKFECLKVILQRNQKRKSLGPSLVNRLLNVCAQYGQAECLSLLMTYMSHDPHCAYSLPGDTRGNTAAHIAAKHGHLHCLQALVALGYDVTSENLMHQRPLHLAHQSRSQTCFEYLMMLNICGELLKMLKVQSQLHSRHREQMAGVRSCVDKSKMCLRRYQNLFRGTHQSLVENKDSILDTLVNLQSDLERFIKHTSTDSAAKRKEAREKLDELTGEIERLEDTFEFSPIAETDGAIDTLMASLEEAVQVTEAPVGLEGDVYRNLGVTDEHVGPVLCALVKDVHKEYILENWDTKHIYDKHLGLQVKTKEQDKTDTDSEVIYSEITHVKSNLNSSNQTSDSSDDDDSAIPRSFKPGTGYGSQEPELKGRADVVDSLKDRQKKGGEVYSKTVHIQVPFTDITNKPPASAASVPDRIVRENETERDKSENKDTIKTDEGASRESGDNVENIAPTERPFTQLLSLDERMDLLIAGERAREKLSDSETGKHSSSVKQRDSICTTSFTSITSESTSGTSEWLSKLDFASLETSLDDVTSDSASYWWDAGMQERDRMEMMRGQKVSTTFQEDIRNKIHLNLDNDDSSFEELRKQRLVNHLRHVQQSRHMADNYRERITTSTGEVIGGFRPVGKGRDKKIVVDVNGALSSRHAPKPKPKPRKRGKQKLFNHEDALGADHMTESDFREQYNHMTSYPLSWDKDYETDGEDYQNQVPWYEMPEYGDIIRGNNRLQDNITSEGSRTPQSYV